MNQPMTCARCGAELRSVDVTCPRCLLKLAIEPAARMDEPVDGASSDVPRTRPVAPPLAEIAAAFPEYEVLELIGVGGMGAVYKARQRKLERLVALKVLPREISSDRALAERFLREARALARLSHPSIVAIHELGESGGFPYLALEFVDGVNLRALLRERQLAPREALTIVKELCDALQFAHDEGIVHRDIKPENVLVDRRGRVKVADFGLAKLVGRVDDDFTTRAGVAVGTPHYMAPEQLEHPRDVDHRADLYALGVVLYEMLTGSLPRGNFELPSRRVHVDVRLDDVVLKALEREPSRRYQHAIDVRTDVEAAEVPRASAAARAAPTDDVRELLRELGDDAGAEALDDPETRVVGMRFLGGGIVARTNADATESASANAAARPAPAGDARETARDPGDDDGNGALDDPATRGSGLRLAGRGVVLTLAMWLAFWIVVAFAWNVGPVAFAAALVLGGVLVTKSVRDIAGESWSRWTLPFALGGGALAALGLAAVAIGHVTAWERGVLARYEPPPLSTHLAFARLASALPRDRGTAVPSVRAKAWDLEVPNELFRGHHDVWIAAGFGALLLGAMLVAAARRDELKSAFAAAFPTSLSSALALAILWTCVWVPNMDWRRGTQPTARTFDVAAERSFLAEDVRALLVEAGLTVHGEGSGELFQRSSSTEVTPATLFLAGPSSPFDRWELTWRGVVCGSPRHSIAILATADPRMARVVVDSGTLVSGAESSAARAKAEQLASDLALAVTPR